MARFTSAPIREDALSEIALQIAFSIGAEGSTLYAIVDEQEECDTCYVIGPAAAITVAELLNEGDAYEQPHDSKPNPEKLDQPVVRPYTGPREPLSWNLDEPRHND